MDIRAGSIPDPVRHVDEDAAMRAILEGTVGVTGERFFAALAENMAGALGTYSSWVTEFIRESRQLRALAFYVDGRLIENFHIDVDGTPCEAVIDSAALVHYPENILDAFPGSAILKRFSAVSYMGAPLLDAEGNILGNLAVLDNRPMPEEPRSQVLLRLFAARASSELQRIRAEAEVRRREEKYRRIVETAGEGFVLTDARWTITDVNEAFCRMVGARRESILGKTPLDFTSAEERPKLQSYNRDIHTGRQRSFETTVVSRNGRHIPVLVHGNVLCDDRGDAIGYMAFLADMSVHRKSLALAADVQRGLQPRIGAPVHGWDVAGRTETCADVGGDYYDFLFDPGGRDGRFAAMVGDVTGHGIDAALLMMSARTFLRSRSGPHEKIASLVTEMNRQLTADFANTGHFMTLLYLVLDPGRRRVAWVRAGHDPALVYDPEADDFRELAGKGLALGLDPGYRYRQYRSKPLKPGQVLAICTDGIWEARGQDGRVFGKDRLRRAIRDHARLSAAGIVDAVYGEVDGFLAGREKEDDMTLVVIKLEEDGRMEGPDPDPTLQGTRLAPSEEARGGTRRPWSRPVVSGPAAMRKVGPVRRLTSWMPRALWPRRTR